MVTQPIPVNIVAEDELCATVVQKIIRDFQPNFHVGSFYVAGGSGYIKRKIVAFNHAAKGIPFLVLVDLEAECAPLQVKDWLPVPMSPNLLFRIAVREVESWLLADRRGFSSFLGVRANLVPPVIENITDPKRCLLDLARRSRRRRLRDAIVPRVNTTARVGPDYNGVLSSFVHKEWDVKVAMENSDSLRRAVDAIKDFRPIWPSI